MKGSDFQQVGYSCGAHLISVYCCSTSTHKWAAEFCLPFPAWQYWLPYPELPAMAQPVSPALTGPSLCLTAHWISISNSHLYMLCLFIPAATQIDWLDDCLTHLGAQHLDMFPFSTCSQETFYTVSGELHLPPSALTLEIIQKLLSPEGGTSITALPPKLGFNLVLVPWVWVNYMSTELLLLLRHKFLTYNIWGSTTDTCGARATHALCPPILRPLQATWEQHVWELISLQLKGLTANV